MINWLQITPKDSVKWKSRIHVRLVNCPRSCAFLMDSSAIRGMDVNSCRNPATPGYT